MNTAVSLPPGVSFLQHGWLSANCVVIDGDAKMLIDCGHVRAVAETETGLRRATGLGFNDIDVLLLTHPHSDHAGAARTLQTAGAEIWAHEITADRVNRWDTRALWVSYSGQVHERFSVARAFTDEEVFDFGSWSLTALHAPGHAQGMIALYCPQHRFLISADALWEGGFGPLNPFTEGDDVIEQQRRTLTRLAELEVDWVFPGHGAPFSDFSGVCARARARLDAYQADPRRLARSACKAFLIHHLYESGGHDREELRPYIAARSWARDYAERYFPGTEVEAFARLVLDEAIAQGVVAADGRRIVAVGGEA